MIVSELSLRSGSYCFRIRASRCESSHSGGQTFCHVLSGLTITPQGGSQNVIFVGSGYLTQGELYRVGGLTTGCAC